MVGLWFYLTTTVFEIDFLFGKGPKTVPFEMKFSFSRQKAITRTFQTLTTHIELHRGLVITTDYLKIKETWGMQVLFRPAGLNLESVLKLKIKDSRR